MSSFFLGINHKDYKTTQQNETFTLDWKALTQVFKNEEVT